MGVRKNQATLTATEKQKFVAAVIALKQNGKWDQYVQQHMGAMMAAHRGPAFLPWHREFLRRLELDLQQIDASVTIPYWDWTVDNQTTSSIWGNDLMGPNGRAGDGQVMSGPFAFSGGNWPLAPGSSTQFLVRQMGASGLAPDLPTAAQVTTCLGVTPYDSAPWSTASSPSFRNQLEGFISNRNQPELHNRVHVWIGGSMAPMTSPNDPVFFLHHCNIDRLWAQWQAAHPTLGYLPVTGGPMGHNLNDPMQPWGGTTTPASVLDHRALGYCYDTEPGCVGKAKEKEKEFWKDKLEKREKIELKETLKREKPERKELKREKIEKPERKELKREKIEKPERKELKREKIEKPEKIEIKEGKLESKEFKEPKELKERKPELEKQLQLEKGTQLEKGPREIMPMDVVGGGVMPTGAEEEPVADRIERLEGMVEELLHFIGGELRPDLSAGALAQEPDIAALSQQLEKDAADAKQAKDAKDVEKLNEL